MKKENNNKRALKEQKGTHRVNNWTEYSMLSYTRMLFPLVKCGMVWYGSSNGCRLLMISNHRLPNEPYLHILHIDINIMYIANEKLHTKQPCVLENNCEQKQAKQKKNERIAHSHTMDTYNGMMQCGTMGMLHA